MLNDAFLGVYYNVFSIFFFLVYLKFSKIKYVFVCLFK